MTLERAVSILTARGLPPREAHRAAVDLAMELHDGASESVAQAIDAAQTRDYSQIARLLELAAAGRLRQSTEGGTVQ